MVKNSTALPSGVVIGDGAMLALVPSSPEVRFLTQKQQAL
jgi:hypothetical protein